jgi:hypothetical protein
MSIKREWMDVLGTVREATYGPALLAGGALRDADHDREVKDLDVFIPVKDNSQFHYVVSQLTTHWGEPSEAYQEEETYRTWNHKVTGVAGWYLHTWEQPVQVVGFNIPEFTLQDLVASFDIGLCQIVSNGLYTWRSPAYYADVRDHRITVMPCQQGISLPHTILERTLKRLVRISGKYPGWHPRVSEDFFGNADPTTVQEWEDIFSC